MSKTWFTAANHFGHKRIIEFAKRPFNSVQQMDEHMIYLWNCKVAFSDTVIHVGDFAFADHEWYLSRLNGQKRLILGNHDHSKRWKPALTKNLWATVDDMLTVTVDDTSIVCCHYGMHVWNRSHYGALHFYGHSHGNLPGDSQSTDVGVDCWDFRPVSLKEIKERLATLPQRRAVDHHVGGSDEAGKKLVKEEAAC